MREFTPPTAGSAGQGNCVPGPHGGGDRLRPVVFSTDAIEARHRFDAWCAEFSGLNDIILPREDRAAFTARCAAWRLGAFTLAASDTPAMRLARRPWHAARDGLDHWILRVARRGTVRTQLGDIRHETQARQVVLYSVADGFDGDWSAAEWVTLWIQRDAFPALTAGLSMQPPGPRTGVVASLLADLLLSLPDHLAQAGAAEAPAIVESIRSMISACLLGGAAARAGTPADSVPSGNPLLRERVRRVIRDNIRSPRLTPERIARAAGMSRSALYRMLEAEGGVARHVLQVRLGLVHAALGDPTRATCPIAALAEEHGFYDASAFSRVFRRVYGCTPGDVRTAALAGCPVPQPGDGVVGDRDGRSIAALLRSHATHHAPPAPMRPVRSHG